MKKIADDWKSAADDGKAKKSAETTTDYSSSGRPKRSAVDYSPDAFASIRFMEGGRLNVARTTTTQENKTVARTTTTQENKAVARTTTQENKAMHKKSTSAAGRDRSTVEKLSKIPVAVGDFDASVAVGNSCAPVSSRSGEAEDIPTRDVVPVKGGHRRNAKEDLRVTERQSIIEEHDESAAQQSSDYERQDHSSSDEILIDAAGMHGRTDVAVAHDNDDDVLQNDRDRDDATVPRRDAVSDARRGFDDDVNVAVESLTSLDSVKCLNPEFRSLLHEEAELDDSSPCRAVGRLLLHEEAELEGSSPYEAVLKEYKRLRDMPIDSLDAIFPDVAGKRIGAESSSVGESSDDGGFRRNGFPKRSDSETSVAFEVGADAVKGKRDEKGMPTLDPQSRAGSEVDADDLLAPPDLGEAMEESDENEECVEPVSLPPVLQPEDDLDNVVVNENVLTLGLRCVVADGVADDMHT